jgi:hypothetical protein
MQAFWSACLPLFVAVAIPVEQLRDEQGRLILPGATKEALNKLPEF